mmetsp:Transcript_17242/g.22433  ORF Transcript_17242/g.22433 Transcript_17242/m.22433 type:complete len:250 (+) Transcript_17242:170-919(+)|eukprot:CAMPEP_0198143012 /NCGR_PEP_ID=MMETSP1443-20131203/5648_1 /TAXON_ID=186043 /ORGANISM="Entomoneis sp., Strain CCMP2396" /LENGTH=249 /DNA_ID=CAMNT_0043806149 /DNA_START=119 /DNA_END=868 /DNA_ORIENTATION=-
MSSRLILRQLLRQRPLFSAIKYQSTGSVIVDGLISEGGAVRQASVWLNHTSVNNTHRGFSSKPPKDEENKDTEVPKEAADEAEAAEDATPEPSKEEQLEAQVKELRDQLMRSLAEAENTRKIAARDVDSARQFAIKSFAKALLDVSDNLSRALDAVPEEALADKKNTVLATLYEGIDMTDKGLSKAFESNGLVKFGEAGDVFDPNLHAALYEYPDKEKKAGTIGQVMKPGFFLHKRVLRPAEVGVVKEA